LQQLILSIKIKIHHRISRFLENKAKNVTIVCYTSLMHRQRYQLFYRRYRYWRGAGNNARALLRIIKNKLTFVLFAAGAEVNLSVGCPLFSLPECRGDNAKNNHITLIGRSKSIMRIFLVSSYI